MQLTIDHITTYSYSEPAIGIVQHLKMTPRSSECQQVLNWRVDVDADGRLIPGTDMHGNLCHRFYADGPLDRLVLHVTGTVITSNTHGVLHGLEEALPPMLYRRSTPLTAITPAIAEFAHEHRCSTEIETLHKLMLGVQACIEFQRDVTEPGTTADATLNQKRGVCQDLTQLFVAAARHLGHPARYVSGHYATAGHPDQEAAHAWAEAWVPDLGWVCFDPTHGLSGSENHIRVAVGLDSLDAAPVRGYRRGGGAESLAVGVFGRQSGKGAARGQSQGQSQA